MLYLAGKAGLGAPISWWRRDGAVAPMRTTPVNWFALRFSPDGRRLAMNVAGVRTGIWIYDHEQDTAAPLPDSGPRDTGPIWTPDGRRIAFASSSGGRAATNIYWQAIDGSGAAERLTNSPHAQIPGSWHPDGRTLAFQEQVAPGNFDLMLLPLGGEPAVFLSTPASETDPAFSPDGRWVAYVSNESGRSDVYVRPFHGSGKWRISTDGGTHPTWSRTKHELFYGTDDGQIMSVPTAVDGDAFRAGKPRPWAAGRFAPRVSRMFDLHPDGERFAIAPAQDLAPPGGDRLTLILNVLDELRRVAPAGKP